MYNVYVSHSNASCPIVLTMTRRMCTISSNMRAGTIHMGNPHQSQYGHMRIKRDDVCKESNNPHPLFLVVHSGVCQSVCDECACILNDAVSSISFDLEIIHLYGFIYIYT